MKLWKNNKKNQKNAPSNNRINIVIAIIFLLGASVLWKLYDLQVKKHDLYSAKASGQYFSFNILEPERGKIFIQDKAGDGSEKLYPLATNKEFALVYAVPKDVKKPLRAAAALYEVFKKEKIEEEADKIVEQMDEERLNKELAFLGNKNLPPEEKSEKEAEIRRKHEAVIKDPDYLELKKIRREKAIESMKKEAVKEYLRILTKKNDPYEPIAKKVDEKTLKKLYALLARPATTEILDEFSVEGIGVEAELAAIAEKKPSGGDFALSGDDLEVKGNSVFYKKNNGDLEEIKFDGIAFMRKERRYYPERNIGSHIVGFVGYDDSGGGYRGRYGLEGFFNEELFGKTGSVKTGRGAGGELVIANDRVYEKPVNGSNIILTVNKTVQFTACRRLNETAEKYDAEGGTVIVMEPNTGAILAMCSWPDYDPNNYNQVESMAVYNNPAIFSEYEPGSIFKSITMAAALDSGKVTPETVYEDKGKIMVEGWPKPIKNSDYETRGAWGVVNMNTVLEESLNTGAIFAMKKTGADVFARYVKDFGFGEKTGIELETESAGNIRNLLAEKIKPIDAAVASFGQGITVTPLQMAAAYAAIANGGILMKPYLVSEIIHSDGSVDKTQPRQIKRVISERAAILLSGMLVNVVENGHARRAGVDGYYVAGKTGTAQVAAKNKKGYSDKTIHTFVGFAPAENPAFVMLVKLDNPKGVKYSSASAAPLFGEIAEFLLNYLEIPRER